jgi:hypothetical protein
MDILFLSLNQNLRPFAGEVLESASICSTSIHQKVYDTLIVLEEPELPDQLTSSRERREPVRCIVRKYRESGER